MGLFSRTPRSRFPADMLQWLERFGRYSFDTFHNGDVGGPDMWDRMGPLVEYSRSDQDGFLAELWTVIDGDQSGFATFGAARLAFEMFGSECLRIPAALPFVDVGIEFKRARGLSDVSLTGYESQRVAQLRRQAG